MMRWRSYMIRKRFLLLITCLFFALLYLPRCAGEPAKKPVRKKIDYIRPIAGENDSIPAALAEKGEVLISYSDCFTCHKKDQRSVGPAFTDIAKRYPANKVFIEMLAQKVIIGGNGAWGHPVMAAHPKLSLEEAKTMVSYIMSLKK